MRLAKITTYYPAYLKYFFARHSDLAGKSFIDQKQTLDFDSFGWADYWSHALTPLGYDVLEITSNVESMQRAWAKENSIRDFARIGLKDIVVAQLKKFRPEVLWFEDHDEELLKVILSEISSIRLVLGWTGSAVPMTRVWRHMDLVLSCAPESVDYLQRLGVAAEHIHHGFDPRINTRVSGRGRYIDLSFVGQLLRGNQFHLQREELLGELSSQINMQIFSPSADFGWNEDLRAFLCAFISYVGYGLRKIGIKAKKTNENVSYLRRLLNQSPVPVRAVNPKLKPFIRPAVFGMEMFQVLRDSKMSLNVHADSSPRFASNMRLFEITGMGSCMLVDYKCNISELFEPDKEVVVYRTIDECLEKVKWLLEHDDEREAIALAGQFRTLKEHTFAHRAVQLTEIINRHLK